jgi:hypothetical protein
VHHLKFYIIATEQHKKNFFGCLGMPLIMFGGLGGHNFLISNPFLTIVSVPDVQREGVQILFGHQKQ